MQIKKIISMINHLLASFNGFLLVILTLLIVADFVGRYFSFPIKGLTTLSIFILITVIYLGIPLCEEEKSHIKVDLITTRLSRKSKRIFRLFSYWIAILIGFLLVWTSGLEAISAFISKQKTPGVILFLTYPAKFMIVIGLIIYLFQVIINTLEEYKK